MDTEALYLNVNQQLCNWINAPLERREYFAWYCKSGEEPMASEVIYSKG